MKKVFLSILAIVTMGSIAMAQKNDSRDQYLTGARFIDHTFVGASAGINTLLSRDNGLIKDNKLTLDLDVYAGKWFTPSVGARVGFQKMNINEQFVANFDKHTILSKVDPDGHNKFGGNYVHGDFMWNMINSLWGYKDRVFNLIPYAHVGWVRMYDPEEGMGSEFKDNELGFGPAIMATVKLAKRLSLVFDVKDIMFSGRFHDYDDAGVVNNITASAGLMFNIGKTDWERYTPVQDRSADLASAMAALAAAQAALDQANKEKADLAKKLAKKLADLENKPVEKDVVYVKTNLGVAPIVLYYDINSAILNKTELRHLDDYVKSILEQDADRVFYLTGSADKGTGTLEYNTYLAAERAKNVKKILMEEYNVSEDNIVLNEGKVSDENENPRFDRSVVVEH